MKEIRAFKEVHDFTHKLIESLQIPRGAKVLDAAAGNGALTKYLENRGLSVVPIEISPQNWAASAKPQCFDLNRSLPYKDNDFDLVVSLETIEHLDSPYLFLRELIRVLKPGGDIIISTPNPHSFKSRLKYFFISLPALFDFVPGYGSFGGHISPVSIGHFLWSFDENGVKLKNVFSCGPPKNAIFSVSTRIINLGTLLIINRLRERYRNEPKHYLSRLTPIQLKNLNDDLILFVHGVKQ